MTKEEHIKYWLESARHDLETAESMFQSGKYDWCLFIGHLVLEKTLKALFVARNDNNMPPKTHNLVKLAQLSQVEVDREQRNLLDKVTDFNIQTRYPDYKLDFYKRCTKEYTDKYFCQIKELNVWLKSLIK
ncbi:MAG: HEPN domain-containing protein [Candidatus Electrothrix sp. ATG1]|nr:HEPN domain-containing protein [Candidatus Electrothrix sp. ATG1]